MERPASRVRVCFEDGRVSRVELLKSPAKAGKLPREIREYLSGRRRRFSIKPVLRGAPFHVKVWKALMRVPYGRAVTYSELARMAGSPRAARAVGQAMHANPTPLIVPCHRVVASGGKLGGFSCGLEWKKFLLDLETKKP